MYRVVVFSKENKELYKKDALRVNILCLAVSCAQIVSFLPTIPASESVFVGGNGSIIFARLLFLVFGGLGIAGLIKKKPVNIMVLIILSILFIFSSVLPLIFSTSDPLWEILIQIPALVFGAWLFIESFLFRYTYKNYSPFDELKRMNNSIYILRTDFVYPDPHLKNRDISRLFNTLFILNSVFVPIDLPIAVIGIIKKKIVCPKVTRIWALINAAAIGAYYVYFIAFGADQFFDAHSGSMTESVKAFIQELLIISTLTIGFVFAVAAAVTAWKYKPIDMEQHDKSQ